MKEPKNIEKLFKESFNGFEADPGVDAWSNIQSQLNSPIASTSASAPNNGVWLASGSKLLTTVIAASIVGISIAGYFYFDSKGTEKKNERISKEQIDPVVDEKAELKDATLIENESTEQSTFNETPEKANKATTEQPQTVLEESTQTVNVKIEEGNDIENANLEVTDQTNTIDKNSIEEPIIVEEKNQIEQEFITNSADADNSHHEKASSLDETNQEIEASKENTDSPNPPKKDISAINEKSAEDKAAEPVFSIPNIFTPNHDNINDVFEIKVENVDEIQVQIFNNAGRLIHHWTGKYGFWDGRNLDDTQAPTGVYFYKVVVKKDGKTYPKQGNVTLTR